MDRRTRKAIGAFSKKTGCSKKVDFNLYTELYYNVPLDRDALQRRYALVLKKHQEKIKAQQEQARLQAQQKQKQLQQQHKNIPKQQVNEVPHPE